MRANDISWSGVYESQCHGEERLSHGTFILEAINVGLPVAWGL